MILSLISNIKDYRYPKIVSGRQAGLHKSECE